MFKRIISVLLCVVMLTSVLASCDMDDSHNHEMSELTTEQQQGTMSDHTDDETESSDGTTKKPDQHIHTSSTAVTENLVDSTCTTMGSYDEVVYCSVCSEEISRTQKIIEKKAHDYSEKVATQAYMKADATCSDSALYYYSCICGDKGTATFRSGDPSEHTYDQKITTSTYLKDEATCMASAVYFYSCTCGAKGTITFSNGSANGHSFGEWFVTKEPTEDIKGEKRRDCKNCDAYETDVVAELAHDHSRWEQTTLSAVVPTCTTTGLTEGKKCSRCGKTLVAQEIIPVN